MHQKRFCYLTLNQIRRDLVYIYIYIFRFLDFRESKALIFFRENILSRFIDNKYFVGTNFREFCQKSQNRESFFLKALKEDIFAGRNFHGFAVFPVEPRNKIPAKNIFNNPRN